MTTPPNPTDTRLTNCTTEVAGVREQADGPQPKVARAALRAVATRLGAHRPAVPRPEEHVMTRDLIDRVCPRFASGANEIISAGCCGRPRGGRPTAGHPSRQRITERVMSDQLVDPVRTRFASGANEITAQPAHELRRAS